MAIADHGDGAPGSRRSRMGTRGERGEGNGRAGAGGKGRERGEDGAEDGGGGGGDVPGRGKAGLGPALAKPNAHFGTKGSEGSEGLQRNGAISPRIVASGSFPDWEGGLDSLLREVARSFSFALSVCRYADNDEAEVWNVASREGNALDHWAKCYDHSVRLRKHRGPAGSRSMHDGEQIMAKNRSGALPLGGAVR